MEGGSDAALEAAKASAQEDEEIQRKRLLIQNGKFKALANWFTKFSREIESGTLEQCEIPLKNLIKEILNMENWSVKMDRVRLANQRDEEDYHTRMREQEIAIAQAEQQIDKRKSELEGARLVRQHNEEYEKLREQIMQHSQRSATVMECEQLEADILSLGGESERLNAVADRRRKQLALLLYYLEDLVTTIEDEAAFPVDQDPGVEDMQVAPMEEDNAVQYEDG